MLEHSVYTEACCFHNIRYCILGLNKCLASISPGSLRHNLGSRIVFDNVGSMREVSKDSSSDRCFNLAKNWLQKCQDNHEMCRAAQATSLPTRVIYLGKSDEELRLCITHGTSAKYATLSHCWGQITLPTLSMNNIQRLQLAIDFSVLPKSFQDAMTVTRRLGVQYLWIDSLCIIQDSAQDWEQESAKMADIYINAWFTIAATGAHDARGGLFIPSEYRGQAVEIPCPGSAGEPNFIYARESRD